MADTTKQMLDLIYRHIGIEKILREAAVAYKDLPEPVRNFDYQCTLSLTKFKTEAPENQEVIIIAGPNGHLTLYDKNAFERCWLNQLLLQNPNSPYVLPEAAKSIIFIVNPHALETKLRITQSDTPICPIEPINPPSIFWWYQ